MNVNKAMEKDGDETLLLKIFDVDGPILYSLPPPRPFIPTHPNIIVASRHIRLFPGLIAEQLAANMIMLWAFLRTLNLTAWLEEEILEKTLCNGSLRAIIYIATAVDFCFRIRITCTSESFLITFNSYCASNKRNKMNQRRWIHKCTLQIRMFPYNDDYFAIKY